MVSRLRATYQHHRFIILLLSAVVIVYGAITIHIERNFPDVANGFDRQYSPVAEHLVRSGVYSMGSRDSAGNLIPTASVPPLYTMLYAASFWMFGIGRAAFEAMRILQIFLHIGVMVVVWRIGAQFNDRAGKIAAVIAALDLTAFYFANNYETPDTTIGFFMALWFLYLVKFLRWGQPRHAWWSACALGLATLTKVVVSLLWVPLLALLLIFALTYRKYAARVRLHLISAFVAVAIVLVGGWGMRNYFAIGTWTLGASATPLRWNAAQLVAYQQRISLTEARQRLADQYITEDLLRAGEGVADREVSRAMASLIVHAPIDYAMVTMRALPGMFFGTFPPYMLFSAQGAQEFTAAVAEAHGFRALVPRLVREGRLSPVLVYVGAKLHLIALFLGAIIACVVFARRPSMRWILAIALLMIAYTVVAAGAVAQARHRTIVFPILYMLGGYGAAFLMQWWRELRYRVRESVDWTQSR